MEARVGKGPAHCWKDLSPYQPRYSGESGGTLGVKVRNIVRAMVPDDITVEMVSNRLFEDDCNSGYILDGSRTIPQAEAIGKF